MPAATTSDNRVLALHTRKIEGGNRNLLEETTMVHGDCIPRIFGDSYTIATTSLDDAGDIRRLYLFPAGAYLTDLRVTVTDSDTHATPTLVFDVVSTDSSDVVSDVFINDTDIGQGGGTARVANTGIGQYIGGKYLAFKVVTAAATPAAMTLTLFLSYAVGINTYVAGPKPYMNDAAI